jgi:hypothetical protein
MSVSARPQQKFLKAIGSSDDPMAPDWMDSAPQELEIVHFSKNPVSVHVDDLLVYYATGYMKIIGVVQVFTKPQFDAQLDHWQYWCDIRPKLMIKDMERAPDLTVINIGTKDFKKTVMQMDYAILTDAEYATACRAISRAVDLKKGDLHASGFNREEA